ncbi:hypothetical protein CR513_37001, partial [Mucuna pruriens]
MKKESLSQERPTLYGRREDLDGRTNLKSSPKRQRIKVKWCAMSAKSQNISNLNVQVWRRRRRRKFFFKKKNIMATWEDLDLFSSKEEDEKANICLMTNIALEGGEDDEKSSLNYPSRTPFILLNPSLLITLTWKR